MTALDRFFESYYRLRPVNATFTGVHAHDHRLPDWSPDGLDAATGEMRALRAELAAGSATLQDRDLTDVGTRDRELAISFLDIQIAEHESTHFQRGNPSLAIGEALFGVIALMTRPFAPAAERAAAAIARLAATPAFLDGARRSFGAQVPGEWRLKCLRELLGAEQLLGTGIRRWIEVEAIPSPLARRLLEAAADALAAFRRYGETIERETAAAPAARHAAGAEMFDLLLARGHWTGRPRADLARDAAEALDEALARLNERAGRAASGGWPEIADRLAAAHPDVDGYLAAYQRTWDACRQKSDACGLVTWPDYPIRYVPIPVQTRDAAPFLYYLFYRSPAPFDRLPVHDYVVTPVDATMDAAERERRLRAANQSVITLNHVVHHGAIGHHVQNYNAYHGASEIGRVAAVDCASRIGMFLGGTMAEGWACYATDLMDECGFLTADESIAQQHTRARLLARAVADIGLHEGTLTIEAAAAVYRDRVGMPAEAARAEACKNSMFPATAVMYWLGTDALHGLRAAQVRGDVTLRQFHDRLLTFGSIPVPLIARVWS